MHPSSSHQAFSPVPSSFLELSDDDIRDNETMMTPPQPIVLSMHDAISSPSPLLVRGQRSHHHHPLSSAPASPTSLFQAEHEFQRQQPQLYHRDGMDERGPLPPRTTLRPRYGSGSMGGVIGNRAMPVAPSRHYYGSSDSKHMTSSMTQRHHHQMQSQSQQYHQRHPLEPFISNPLDFFAQMRREDDVGAPASSHRQEQHSRKDATKHEESVMMSSNDRHCVHSMTSLPSSIFMPMFA